MKTDGKCRHYNGAYFEKTCRAGINLRSLVGGPNLGWIARLPCIDGPKDGAVTCEKYEPLTAEDRRKLAAERREAEQSIKYTLGAILAIKSMHGKKNVRGEMECPKCGGKLHYSVAEFNGHVHGACETKDCLRWME